MAACLPAFATDDNSTEQDSLIPVRPVATPAFFYAFLLPAFLYPVEQLLVDKLRVTLLQPPAGLCIIPVLTILLLHISVRDGQPYDIIMHN